MTYDKTVYMITYLVFLDTREMSYLFNITKYHKCEDTARHTHVKIDSKDFQSILRTEIFSNLVSKYFFQSERLSKTSTSVLN